MKRMKRDRVLAISSGKHKLPWIIRSAGFLLSYKKAVMPFLFSYKKTLNPKKKVIAARNLKRRLLFTKFDTQDKKSKKRKSNFLSRQFCASLNSLVQGSSQSAETDRDSVKQRKEIK
jgi:hypothetical protein